MRFVLGSVLAALVVGCPASHGIPDDSGTQDAAAPDVPRLDSTVPRFDSAVPRADTGPLDAGLPCEGRPPVCSASCEGDDGLIPALCEGGEWTCPPDSVDRRTCCAGDPRPGCTCEAGVWTCVAECLPGIDPFELDGMPCRGDAICPEAPECGGPTCECRSDVWSCSFVEPTPGCFCDSEPVFGAPCAEDEGMVCGECCPGPGEWPAMQCSDGRWGPTVCPDVECPVFTQRDCPVDTAVVLGGLCPVEGQSCGDACCGSAIVCEAARWRPGPIAECLCQPGSACGEGGCPEGQGCRRICGPDDGSLFSCFHLPEGCRDCSCVPLQPGHVCDMVDGAPLVSDTGLCG